MGRPKTTVEEFWRRVNKSGPTAGHMVSCCWVWTGHVTTSGYGCISFCGHMYTTHRLVMAWEHGTVPENMCVLHHCDNRLCVRPEHLYFGSKKDNSDDMFERGRANRATGDRNGSRLHPESRLRRSEHPMTTLTEDQVAEMRASYAAGGVTMQQLAAYYGIWKGSVHRILRLKTWA